MAGGRRRSSQAPTTSDGDAISSTAQTASAPSEGNTARVTRSSRGNRDTGTNRNNRAGPSSVLSRPSRIVTLKTGRPRNIAAQETASPQEQSTATSHQPEPSDLLQNPHTPRARRSRKSIPAEETPRSTRHSARLKAQSSLYSNEDATPDEEEEGKELPGSPGTASNDESNDASQGLQNGIRESQDRKTSATTPPMPDDPTSDPAEEPNRSQRGDSQGSNAEHNPDHKVPKEPSPEDGKPTFQQSLSNPVNTPSPSGPRKRKSNDLEEDDPRSGTGSPAKKVKIDSELDPVPEEQSPDENNEKKESDTPMDGTEESRGDGEPDQTMKEADTTPETGIEISSTPRTRGGKRGVRGRRRGRGGRNRPVARVNTIRRGAGRGRASRVRGGRAHANFSDDVEFRRSPSPSAETKKLRDRQRELDKAFRRVAAAQRLALAELASQSENRLMRDKTAHATVAEYEIVKAALRERLQAKQEELRHEYELKVEQEMRLLEAEKGRINESFRDSARHVKEEHLRASQGAYMSFVEGQRAAEDDEHTETDDSDTERGGRVSLHAPKFVRGFNSSSVRTPAGAALYQLAKDGWDNFVQRAKVGEDIDPHIREMGQGRDRPHEDIPAQEALGVLLKASGVVAQEEEASAAASNALPILAEAAAARPPAVQQRPLHPQVIPGPSFLLPRPQPQPQPQPQPRRLLPAGQQMLPDPFGGHGPPHLPPPPGSNFQRPPVPGFLPPQRFYYPPPPPRPPY